jgi:hypothetical protein
MTNTQAKVYKLKFSTTAPVLLIPLLLIYPAVIADVSLEDKVIGLTFFLIPILFVALIPLGSRLVITSENIAIYFFGFHTSIIRNQDVVKVKYQNIMKGGLGFGKGLVILTAKGTIHSISEFGFGKTAIEHAKEVLGKYVTIEN